MEDVVWMDEAGVSAVCMHSGLSYTVERKNAKCVIGGNNFGEYNRVLNIVCMYVRLRAELGKVYSKGQERRWIRLVVYPFLSGRLLLLYDVALVSIVGRQMYFHVYLRL